MEISIEEKKAIEGLKKIRESTQIANDCGLSNNDFNEDLDIYDTVLNLIEKQQKEIKNSISKDKIREMKNELNEEFEKNNSSGIYGNDYYIESEKYAFVEEKLNELLEE